MDGPAFLAPQSRARPCALSAWRSEEEGVGRGAFALCFRKFQSGFVRLPAPELLSLCVLTPPQDAVANSEAGPKGGGQDARSQEKVAKEKEHPDATLSGRPALRVREAWPGFSSGLLLARKGESIHGLARCAAFSSTPHHRIGAPEKQRAPALRSSGQSKAGRSAARFGASISRYGAA